MMRTGSASSAMGAALRPRPAGRLASRCKWELYPRPLEPMAATSALRGQWSISCPIARARSFIQQLSRRPWPLAKARAFTARLGLPEAQSPVVPLILGPPEAALAASRKLAGKGFLVTAIRPPTVPADTARLRFAFTAMHPGEEIARLAEAVTSLGEFKAARTQGLQESRA